MNKFVSPVFAALALVVTLGAAPAWSPEPWLADLRQIRAVIEQRYPNLEWLTVEHGASVDELFGRAEDALRQSGRDDEARRAIERLIARLNDGHVVVTWPPSATTMSPAANLPPQASAPSATRESFCAALGYDAGQVSAGTAAALPGYRALQTGGHFGAGLADTRTARLGVVRIGVFSPQGYPGLCAQAVADLQIDVAKPCGQACEDRISAAAYKAMTRDFADTLEALKKAGAQALLVDISQNGGGSEWAEAAARMVSPRPLTSARVVVVRDEAWVKRWSALADELRRQAAGASSKDRKDLHIWAEQAAAMAQGVKPCAPPNCSRLGQSGFATGLIPNAAADRFIGKPWGPAVFSPAQFPYRDAIWRGPVIVLVDSETWSAAEQFAAVLRDNDAAIILGGRTGGAGCGHIGGKQPITLAHSGATLELPNCARLRRDGGNEVGGVIPDVMTGARWNDGRAFAGQLTASRLDEAVQRAKAQVRAGRR